MGCRQFENPVAACIADLRWCPPCIPSRALISLITMTEEVGWPGSGRMLVTCPRCGGLALVIPRPGLSEPRYFSELLFQPRHLACGGCGAVAEWKPEIQGAGLVGAVFGGSEDPFFQRASTAADPLRRSHLVGLQRGAHRRAVCLRRSAITRAWRRAADDVDVRSAASVDESSDNRSEVLASLETLRGLAKRMAPAGAGSGSRELLVAETFLPHM